jgi:hypothetical protein
MLIEYIRE